MALEAKHVIRLFSRMLHLYGHKWSSVYGTALNGTELSLPAKQWMHDLQGYTPEQVAVGLQVVLDRRLEWPPGPIEFANLCDGIPTLAEVLDRDNDYGPVCAEIRRRMDWYRIDGLPSAKVPQQAKFGMERALTAIKRDGTMHAIQAQRQAALARQAQEALA